MRASPSTTISALPALIALITISRTAVCDSVDGFCDATLTEESELRWSKEQLAFVAWHSGSHVQSGIPRELGRNGSLLCIRAPDKRRVVLQFYVNTSDGNATSVRHGNFCGSNISDGCKTTCLSVREAKLFAEESSNYYINGSFIGAFGDVSLQIYNLSRTHQQHSVSNSTKFHDQIDHLPRFLSHQRNISSRNDTPSPKSFDKRGIRKRKGYRCRKCFQKDTKTTNRKRSRRRKNLWKAIAKELLLEYHKRWVIDQKEAGKRRTDGETLQMPVLSPESRQARDRVQHFIEFSRRRRTRPANALRCECPKQRSPGLAMEPARPVTPPASGKRKKRRRARRLALESTSSVPNEQTQSSSTNFRFCALDSSSHTADSGTRHTQQGIYASSRGIVQRDFPVFLHSKGRQMRIRVPHPLVDNVLLGLLLIKISFSSDEKDIRGSHVTTASMSNSNLAPTRTEEIALSSHGESRNRTASDSDSTTRQHTPEDRHDGAHLIIGAAFGGFLIFVLASVCLLCLHRKRSSLYSSNSRRSDLGNEGETVKCLSSVENCETRSDFDSPRIRLEGRNLVDVNERRMMLEHKKHKHSHHKPGKVKRKEDVTDSPTSHETKHQQQGRQHVTQCKHLLTIRGSSRHEHCIVCQIAGKPHQPIMNAQYATEFLPPASRHNGTPGYNSSPQYNFDKFNRLQNNPYRHSPSLTPKNAASLPLTIKLPDGEERYRSRKDLKLQSEGFRDPIPVCVKAPPNRTIFASEPLPFSSTNGQKLSRKANGYPGPPTSVSKNANFERSGDREGRSRISAPGDNCICRYIIKHIDEPPPEYSDVIKEGPLPRKAEDSASNSGSLELDCRKKAVSNPQINTG